MEEHEAFFRDLVDNAHDLIQSVSPEGRFLYVNRAWLDTLGYTQEDLDKLKVFDVVHADGRDHCMAVMKEVMQGEPAIRIETEFVTKDGRKVAVEGSASCRFVKGKPVATRGIFRDVSERNQIRDELDRLFNLSLDMLCVAGIDGYFRHINPAFERVLGYTKEELLNRSFVDFVHPDDRPGTVQQIERQVQGLPVVDFKNRYLAKDGAYRWLAWRATPPQESGLIYAIARDITEEKQNQEILARTAEDLARSNADLEQFAYAASHDLLSPLRTIANLSEWIEEAIEEKEPEKAIEHLDKLRHRVRQMRELTEDLLRYSRVGRESTEITRVDTKELIRSMTQLLDPPAGFKVTTDENLPAFETDKPPLDLVFRNLVGNAIKHHNRQDGEVVVSALDQGDYYEFSVADDGPGIPEQFQDKIFNMFHKLKPKSELEGTGMGLALVKRIVENQGGRVTLVSSEGRGANFRFTWPKRSAANGESNAKDSSG
jgi:PAS domain S-box-containing protein